MTIETQECIKGADVVLEERQSLGSLTVADKRKASEGHAIPQREGNINPTSLLHVAVSRGASMDELGKLIDLQERMEKREAEKQFVAAMAKFKKVAPTIIKDKHVSFTTDRGNTEYDHATLGAIVEACVGKMGEFGLSHSWRSQQDPDGTIRVTCVLRHVAGHVDDDVWLQAKPDASGGKNSIQAVGSATAYLQRYTFMMALGLAAKGGDDDGRAAGSAAEQAAAQAEQMAGATLESLKLAVTAAADIKGVMAVWSEHNGKLLQYPKLHEELKAHVQKRRNEFAAAAKKE